MMRTMPIPSRCKLYAIGQSEPIMEIVTQDIGSYPERKVYNSRTAREVPERKSLWRKIFRKK